MKKAFAAIIVMAFSLVGMGQKSATYLSSQGNYSYWDSLTQVFTSPSYFEHKPAVKITITKGKLTISKSSYVLYKEVDRMQDVESYQIMWEAVNAKKKKCNIRLVMHPDVDTGAESIALYVIYPNKIFGYLID